MRATSRPRSRLAPLFCAVLMLVAPTASIAKDAAWTPAHPALWRVRHGAATVYLFGSMHVLPTGYAWTTPQIDAAMAQSDIFIFEVPVDQAALKEEKDFIVRNGLLGRRQSLRGALTPDEFETYSAVLRRAGLRPEQFERYRPWLAAILVGLAYLHGDQLTSLRGADDDLMAYAREHGRQLLYLEGIRDQMELMAAGDDLAQVKALRSLLLSLSGSRAQETELRESWASGDAKAFTALLEGYFQGRPETKDLLIDARNRKWLPVLQQYLARPSGTTMVTVGAAHIGGGKGLIALLCAKGYAVERVREPGLQDENDCGPGS